MKQAAEKARKWVHNKIVPALRDLMFRERAPVAAFCALLLVGVIVCICVSSGNRLPGENLIPVGEPESQQSPESSSEPPRITPAPGTETAGEPSAPEVSEPPEEPPDGAAGESSEPAREEVPPDGSSGDPPVSDPEGSHEAGREEHPEESGPESYPAVAIPEYDDLFSSRYEHLTLKEKIQLLREKFPDGSYWNFEPEWNWATGDPNVAASGEILTQEQAGTIVSQTPCNHSASGYYRCHTYNGKTRDLFNYWSNTQCLGFASMISDFLFGKEAEIEIFYDFDRLSVGDHIRFLAYEHSMIVVEKNENSVKVLECTGIMRIARSNGIGS